MCIWIITATEEESSFIKQLFSSFCKLNENIIFGNIDNIDIICCTTGIGAKSALYMLTSMTCKFESPDIIINCGIAGQIKRSIITHDVIISQECKWIGDDSIFRKDIYISIEKVISETLPKINLSRKNNVIYHGCILCSDHFTTKINLDFNDTEKYVCIDMESIAIAYYAEKRKIPWVCIKSISDNVDHNAVIDMENNLFLCMHNTCEVLFQFITNYRRQKG